MDGPAQVPLQEAAGRRKATTPPGNGELKKLRWAVCFCLLSVLAMTALVFYLLAKITPPCSKAEEIGERAPVPMFQRQQGSPSQSRFKPMAHLTVEAPCLPPCMREQFPFLKWKNNTGVAFLDNMIYSDGFLVVPKGGYYYVYAQVTFRDCNEVPSCCTERKYCGNPTKDVIYVKMTIWKSNDRSDDLVELLSAPHSIEWKRHWEKAVYVGGNVQLEAGDKLMVNVSNPALVSFQLDTLTFFGSFLI